MANVTVSPMKENDVHEAEVSYFVKTGTVLCNLKIEDPADSVTLLLNQRDITRLLAVLKKAQQAMIRIQSVDLDTDS